MNDMGEEAVAEVEFFLHLLQIRIFIYIPWLVSFDLGPWIFILGWRYNPTPCAYQFYIFSLHNF